MKSTNKLYCRKDGKSMDKAQFIHNWAEKMARKHGGKSDEDFWEWLLQ